MFVEWKCASLSAQAKVTESECVDGNTKKFKISDLEYQFQFFRTRLRDCLESSIQTDHHSIPEGRPIASLQKLQFE